MFEEFVMVLVTLGSESHMCLLASVYQIMLC